MKIEKLIHDNPRSFTIYEWDGTNECIQELRTLLKGFCFPVLVEQSSSAYRFDRDIEENKNRNPIYLYKDNKYLHCENGTWSGSTIEIRWGGWFDTDYMLEIGDYIVVYEPDEDGERYVTGMHKEFYEKGNYTKYEDSMTGIMNEMIRVVDCEDKNKTQKYVEIVRQINRYRNSMG